MLHSFRVFVDHEQSSCGTTVLHAYILVEANYVSKRAVYRRRIHKEIAAEPKDKIVLDIEEPVLVEKTIKEWQQLLLDNMKEES